MDIKIKLYNGIKYFKKSEKIKEVFYENIESFKVVDGEEATKIGLTTDENSRDEYNEYLVITLQGGETCTFRNSYVDLFRV